MTAAEPGTAPSCNICGGTDFTEPDGSAAAPICRGCRSSVRFRLVAAAISQYVFGNSSPLIEQKARSELQGVGLSDFQGYAALLSQKTNYTNTFFHREPRLDVANPSDTFAGLDYLIASDVFEHIEPPASRAFAGAFKVLKSGGVLIMSVPITRGSQTIEHFPRLRKYALVNLDDEYLILNKNRAGKLEIYSDLRFHGGAGTTLEFRVFSEIHVLEQLRSAGFTRVNRFAPSFPQYNIDDNEKVSQVFVAIK
jgi:hypothetical protein